MEIGVFGSPGSDMFVSAVGLGIFGLICVAVAALYAGRGKYAGDKSAGVSFAIMALFFLAASMTLLPIGHGRQRVGDCFDRLPAATLAVDGAFQLNDDALYIVVRGKNDDGKVVRVCATLPMGTVKDYPGRPVVPGEYFIVVQDHESGGVKWTTNTFVSVEPAPAAPDKSK